MKSQSFIAICLFFFAFSTIISWYFFGETNVRYLFGNKATKFYALFVIAFVMVGSVLKVDLVWNLSDIFNGLMVIPNIIGIIALSNIVANLGKEY
ncbi:alanine:cation symporter family protein, partial [uncultured Helicobacter sp.]|uniref:alanine:cation symporter family protein n=1 Tax=uncultured Helicobacter sp. TaxID=175537 RepID=UPI00261294A9